MNIKDKVRIGCSGWWYKDWSGIFYSSDLPAKDYLKFYSQVFNCVEIDSSFYRIPNQFMIEQWKRVTPEGFVFSPKMPKKITHENKLENFESTLTYFYSVVGKLGTKLGPIVAQLPPSIKVDKHMGAMEKFVDFLNPKYKHTIEFRHKSWFTPKVYRMLEDHNIAMTWSLNQYLETPPEVLRSSPTFEWSVNEISQSLLGSKRSEKRKWNVGQRTLMRRATPWMTPTYSSTTTSQDSDQNQRTSSGGCWV